MTARDASQMAFCGERTPVLGRTGVRDPNGPLPLDPGLLEGDVELAGGDQRQGEAGRPPLRWPAWQGTSSVGTIGSRP